MLTITQLKDLFAKYDFKPLKRYGENYLIDANIKDKIIAELAIRPDDTVLEIGPGLGALTIDIASSGACVHAIEKDRKAFTILRQLLDNDFPNLELARGDILEADIERIAGGKRLVVAGNLPYYITSPIIEKLIASAAFIDRAVILVQKEFAERILAEPGSKTYSSFSCFVRYYAAASYSHTVKRTSFYPEPDVDSAIVRLDFLRKPAVAVSDEKLLFKIIRGSFNQRRKIVLNSLSRVEVLDMPKDDLTRLLAKARIDPTVRPETLSLDDFARIANTL